MDMIQRVKDIKHLRCTPKTEKKKIERKHELGKKITEAPTEQPKPQQNNNMDDLIKAMKMRAKA